MVGNITQASDRRIELGKIVTFLSCFALGVIALATTAQAQSTNLGSLDGQTRIETQLGNAINGVVCPTLANLEPQTGPMLDLLDRCSDLVRTANDIIGGGMSMTGLGLSASETNEALNEISNRQLPSIGRGGSEIAAVHAGVVSDRLFAVREGAGGIVIAGNLVDAEGNVVPIDYKWFAEDSAAGDDDALGGLGVYLNFVGGFGDRDANSEELGFDFRQLGGVLGADYTFTDSFVSGLAFSYTNTDVDFDSNRGDLRNDAYAGSLYASFHPGDFYVDGIFSYAHNDIDTKRRIVYAPGTTGAVDRTAHGDTDADELSFAGLTGYQFKFGGLTTGPVVRGEYLWLDIDSFTEHGAQGLNLRHSHDSVTSATFGMGAEALYTISTGFGVVVPQLSLEWEHQFEDDSRNVVARYDNDPTRTTFFARTKSPDRDYMNLEASVSATFRGGFSAFLDYSTVLLHSDIDSHVFTLGGRISF